MRNQPTAAALVFSMLCLAALLGGAGLLFAVFGRWDFLGWHGPIVSYYEIGTALTANHGHA